MKQFITNNLAVLLTLCGFIFSGLFWVYTMNGIPKRVNHLENSIKTVETEVNQLSKDVNANDTKINIMLEDIKFIKQLITQKYLP